ncbi:NAD/NADP-dependent octopine/nopaline dehydrogenase family protein [Prosthecobacter fusiformis]|nr:NAD/NADP-dependent octopine/nopaline dehydrogenase family protein [Prosthecobacter fusiformis]
MLPTLPFRKVAILGAGNGGRALAASLRMQGQPVTLWNRNWNHLQELRATGKIQLTGALEGVAEDIETTDNISVAVRDADLVMLVTTADAHRLVIEAAAPFLAADACIFLQPGRTGGAFEIRKVLNVLLPGHRIDICESQSLIFACRATSACEVRVIGIKECVPVAALPYSRTSEIVPRLRCLMPGMREAESLLHTSFENIGAIFHPAIVLFNAAAIERGEQFFFYQDISPLVSDFLLELDQERIKLGRCYGINLKSIFEWIVAAYPESSGDTLRERFRGNPAYHDITSPTQLHSRLLTEDLPTGLVPMVAFGELVGLEMPLMRSLVNIGSSLLKRDFWAEGRNLQSMDLQGLNVQDIIRAAS